MTERRRKPANKTEVNPHADLKDPQVQKALKEHRSLVTIFLGKTSKRQ